MSKLAIPANSKFDSLRAIELASLVRVAYEQFDFAKEQKGWKLGKPKNLMSSSASDIMLNSLNRDSRFLYAACTVLSFTEYTFSIPQTVAFGFIAQRTLQDGTLGVFIVFRGARTLPEVLDHFQTQQEPFLHDDKLGLVCSGIQKLYSRSDGYCQSLQQSIAETLESISTNAQIFIAGHSLGAALATLATIHIASQTSFKKPILYTFASPRVGDIKFAAQFKALEYYRIANSEDFVPAIPISIGKFSKLFESILPKQIYQHAGEPLYFTQHEEYMTDNHDMRVYCEALL